MRPGLGSSWCFNSLDTTWDILGRVPLKNQVLPPDTGKGVLKESGPAKTLFFLSWYFDSLEAQGVSTLQNLAVFHSLGYFWEGAIKKKGPTSGHSGFRWIF